MLVKHKKWLSQSCGVIISVVICFLGMMYAQHSNAAQSAFSHLDTKKREIVQGVGVGDKAVTGVARIVRTLADCDMVQYGDIMVAPMTSDAWLGAMKRCAGIITNGGGASCHAAIFGKQQGIPVIVGAGNATEKIKNGDIITLDCLVNGVGIVYSATSNDLPQQTTVVHHGAPAVIYQQSGSGSVQEHKNTHQQHYYYQPDVQHNYYQDGQIAQGESQKKQYVTQEIFDKHYRSYVDYVLDMQSSVNKGKKAESAMFYTAKWWYGCDPFAIDCIPVSYDFFAQDKNYIKSILRFVDLDSVNNLFEKYKSRPGDMNWLAKISHEEHVRTMPLPEDIENKREELMKNPIAYKKIIDQKKVDEKECYIRIAAGLFVRYCVEKKCVI